MSAIIERTSSAIFNKNLFAFDIETTGLSCYKGAEIFSYCIGDENFNVNVYRVDNKDLQLNKYHWQILQDFFLDTSKIKVAHNYKFELSFLLKAGIFIPENTIWLDTMIMSQCLRNLAPSHALDYIIWEYGGDPDAEFRTVDLQVAMQAKERGNYQKVDKDLMTVYQQNDGIRTMLACKMFQNPITENVKVWNDYMMEVELVKATQHIEAYGLMLDFDNIAILQEDLTCKLEQVRNESFDLLHEFVNLNSDKVVCELLYDRYGFPVLDKTENGAPSVDKDVLMSLRAQKAHPIFDMILKQRSYSNALSTIASYLSFADKKGLIHPNIKTIGAPRTGRQSSSEPNLQNVAKEKALRNPFPVPMRKCYRSRPKHIIAFADYSGIEMRLIANESKEYELIDILKKDGDVHHATVECFLMPKIFSNVGDNIFNAGILKAQELLSNDKKLYNVHRDAYKNTGFCIAYGGGINKVAVVLAKTIEEIKVGDTNYRKRFPRIADFSRSLIDKVLKDGYIITAFGRKLYVPTDKAYIAANYLIQGTAAGILKRAQIKIHHLLKTKYKGKIRMMLPIHDELLFSIPREFLFMLDEIVYDISLEMTTMPEIEVPLGTGWKYTTSDWNDTIKYQFKKAA